MLHIERVLLVGAFPESKRVEGEIKWCIAASELEQIYVYSTVSVQYSERI